MSYLLTVKEIMGFAVHIEERGYQFYVEAMKKFPEPRATELFQYLADEEFQHEKLFRKLQERGGEPVTGQPDAEYQAYMREFVKAHQLGDAEAVNAKLARLSSLAQVLDLAMEFEKDSIVFFSELKSAYGRGGEATIDRVIQEEMGHLRKIFRMKQGLAGK